ncbi:MAG: sigma-70 family RNA polymerase sigma factor [Bacteroidales bacterium]
MTPSTTTRHRELIKKLFEEHADFLYNYAITRVKEHHLAEDLVQETYIAALKNIGTFEGRSRPTTWLIAILKNKIIDYIRKRVRSLNEQSLDALERADDFFTEQGKWKDAHKPGELRFDKGNPMEREEFQRVLKACLGHLKELHRLTFILKYIEGEETETICQELKITASNYWVIIHRAKLQLRECLEKNWLTITR